ncbi:right-handed parallel beta-helix repeat-containing protein [Rossellomorea marisflavi]|uniref:right-handed parallel beta-helix repeat-containing protein n=1 Tax=Rossellomorea marisflavi TaxID=189381 RepID=UPI0025B1AB6B|nr:right-handed parallel beta-helix repeat-containing protein [Rossellomorea marisflavi]MDW4525355.1 right-handed parallel beta-helix repeat-containing protein [Rossellomorea marisflavi]WJV18199.1 right-handed parallel beta-helix repeat-containing protein [Rossellomorea marisflavi]
MKQILSIAIILCCFLPLHTEAAGTSTLFVSPDGDDSDPGTKEQPFKTLKKASKLAVPGTTVYLREGTYPERLDIKHSGTKQEPIRFTHYEDEVPVISGETESADGGLITIRDKSYITIQGLDVGDLSTDQEDPTPSGILVEGNGTGIRILDNRIHDITTTHPNGNAHGIAFYGTEAPEPLQDIEISGNILEDLILGFSEAMTLNGNVKDFLIKGNTIRNVDNIGIDVIGFEGIAPIEQYDQAREGIIRDNHVYNVSSHSNPAYHEEYSAGGIYVDGGKDVVIEHNISHHNDLGIEIASEHPGKQTTRVQIAWNQVYGNRYTGISIGGYDLKRGGTTHTLISHNLLYGNDTMDMDGGQLLMQYHATQNLVENNIMIPTDTGLFLASLHPSNRDNQVIGNVYGNHSSESDRWIWNGQDITHPPFIPGVIHN